MAQFGHFRLGSQQRTGGIPILSLDARAKRGSRVWVPNKLKFFFDSGFLRRAKRGSPVSLRSSNPELLMSALGQKQTLRRFRPMSALPPIADISHSGNSTPYFAANARKSTVGLFTYLAQQESVAPAIRMMVPFCRDIGREVARFCSLLRDRAERS
jgi:hypothetical protein